MKIKVCGMTDIGQIIQLTEMGIDFSGMIFYDNSPRYVRGKIAVGELKDISTLTKLTGVFVNEKLEQVEETSEKYYLSCVQLCGEESPEYCSLLKKKLEVIKVISVGDDGDLSMLSSYLDACDYFLFDTRSEKYGGSGKRFNWDVLKYAEINKPFFLSGGISTDDVQNILFFRHPDFAGIDINSRFETAPGKKDIQKIKIFIDKLKQDELSGR
jgi:phosphoribosylanthranilate isomerase